LDQLVGILRCLGRIGFVVDGEIFQLSPAQFTATLAHRELKAVGDRGAELSIGASVRQHDAHADFLALAEGEFGHEGAGGQQACLG
jgi:hypothetical protein